MSTERSRIDPEAFTEEHKRRVEAYKTGGEVLEAYLQERRNARDQRYADKLQSLASATQSVVIEDSEDAS